MLVGEPCRPMVSGSIRIFFQSFVIINIHGLGEAINDATDGHVTGLIQFLNAGDQARSLSFDHHEAVFQHTLNGNLGAFNLDVSSIGNLGQTQLFSDLGTDLSGIAVNSLTMHRTISSGPTPTLLTPAAMI